jgi:hypothetical protein
MAEEGGGGGVLMRIVGLVVVLGVLNLLSFMFNWGVTFY